MTQFFASAKPTQASAPEYTIYAYHFYDERKLGYNRWKRMAVGSDSDQIVAQAEQLFQSRLYPKIEIRQKIFDSKLGAHQDKSFRVYQQKQRQDRFMVVAGLVLMAALSGFIYLQYI